VLLIEGRYSNPAKNEGDVSETPPEDVPETPPEDVPETPPEDVPETSPEDEPANRAGKPS